MDITGKVKVIGNTIKVSDNFEKRDLVITTDEQYPQTILIQFSNDRTDLIDKLSIGQTVTISTNLRGREWTNPQGEIKYFNSLDGWRVQTDNKVGDTPLKPVANETEVEDDLPF
jgi:hypothetical protein